MIELEPPFGPVAVLTTGLPAAALAVLAALHYLASTVNLRAASGTALPWRECYLTQLAAAAANRVVPGGAGGAALNTRYLTRRGLPMSRAVGAVVSLPVVGAVAKALTISLLLLASGRSAHLHLGSAARVPPWLLAGLAVLVLLAVLVGAVCQVGTTGVRAVLVDLTDLRRRPRDVLTMATMSATTTILLGGALFLSALLVTGPATRHAALGLVLAYGIGAAAGAAVPLPGGLATDAALVTTVVAAGVPIRHAVPAVVLFRVMTFWLPAAFGVLALRRLRRTRAL